MSKSELRQYFKNIRRSISEVERHAAAEAAALHFSTHDLFQRFEHIACYLPFHDEFDTFPIIKTIWQAGKKCYLPILKEEETALIFARFNEGDELAPNRFSILEPVNETKLHQPDKLDCVLMPLLAYDYKGHRLGTGGGYYDRTFAFLFDQEIDKPLMIGVGFVSQHADSLPADPWDIGINAILTEKQLLLLK